MVSRAANPVPMPTPANLSTTRFRRGTLNADKDDLTVCLFEQDWHDTQGTLTLDRLGNWDAVRIDPDGDDTAQSMTTVTRSHNAANEYTSLDGQPFYDHDDNGNLTDDGTYEFHYDYANRLVKVVRKGDSAVIAEYAYDALGRRVKRIVTDVSDTLDGTTLFYYDGLRVIEEGRLDASENYQAGKQYVWGLYLDELLLYDFDADSDGDFDAIDEENGDKRYYVLHDFLYSATAVIDGNGTVLERYDYRPYGAVAFWNPDYTDTRAETHVRNEFLFTGQMLDAESGLYHYKFRVLHPVLGRFLQRDPIDTSSWTNLYSYCTGNPTNYTDPTGRLSCRAKCAIVFVSCAAWGGRNPVAFAACVAVYLKCVDGCPEYEFTGKAYCVASIIESDGFVA